MRAVDKQWPGSAYISDPFPRPCENVRWLYSNPDPWQLANLLAQFSPLPGYPPAGRILPLKGRALLRGRQQTVFSWLAIIDDQLDQTIRSWLSQFLARVALTHVCSGFADCSLSIFGSGSPDSCAGPGSSTRLIRAARPLFSSISTSAPCKRTSPAATGNEAGMLETNRFIIGSIARPRMEFTGPHIPASHKKAVPPGRICSSAVWTWVWVPMTAETLPSRKRPIAIFSLVVSP